MVHRTGITEDRVFILQLLRDQIRNRVYPIHRLDRGTSGVLIFGKNSEIARALGEQIMQKTVTKKYLAVLRGYLPDEGLIDYPIVDDESERNGTDAQTRFWKLGQSLLEMAIGLRYPTARFSLVEAELLTGRRHQIRRHFAHLRHPIIGDPRHGDVKHNKFFRENHDLHRMLLHAATFQFSHPVSGEEINLTAKLDEPFLKMLDVLELKSFCPTSFYSSDDSKSSDEFQ